MQKNMHSNSAKICRASHRQMPGYERQVTIWIFYITVIIFIDNIHTHRQTIPTVRTSKSLNLHSRAELIMCKIMHKETFSLKGISWLAIAGRQITLTSVKSWFTKFIHQGEVSTLVSRHQVLCAPSPLLSQILTDVTSSRDPRCQPRWPEGELWQDCVISEAAISLFFIRLQQKSPCNPVRAWDMCFSFLCFSSLTPSPRYLSQQRWAV